MQLLHGVAMYYRRVLLDARSRTWDFVKRHVVLEASFAIATTGLLLLINGFPSTCAELAILCAPIAGETCVVLVVGLANVVMAPPRFDLALNDQLALFAHPPVEVIAMGWPTQVQDQLVIPVQITNHDLTRAIDLDVDCTITESAGKHVILARNFDAIPDVEKALNSQQRGEGILKAPLQIGPRSRRVGYLAYTLGSGRSFSPADDRVVFMLSDGVENTLLGETEMWPSIWQYMHPTSVIDGVQHWSFDPPDSEA